MNCGKSVTSEDGKVFAECFVCPECFTLAERLYARGSSELKHLLDTLIELIRAAIIRGQLSLPESQEARSPSYSFLDAVTKLAAGGRHDRH
jgi:hypothetical protein